MQYTLIRCLRFNCYSASSYSVVFISNFRIIYSPGELVLIIHIFSNAHSYNIELNTPKREINTIFNISSRSSIIITRIYRPSEFYSYTFYISQIRPLKIGNIKIVCVVCPMQTEFKLKYRVFLNQSLFNSQNLFRRYLASLSIDPSCHIDSESMEFRPRFVISPVKNNSISNMNYIT